MEAPIPPADPLDARFARMEALLNSQARQISHLTHRPSPVDSNNPVASTSQAAPVASSSQQVNDRGFRQYAFSEPPEQHPGGSFVGPPNNPLMHSGSVQGDIAHAALAGLQLNAPQQGHPGNLLDSFLTLGATTTPTVKSKIWAGQYVELSSLSLATQQRPALALSWEGANPTLAMAPQHQSPPQNVAEWLKLFNTFAAIYVEVHPQEAAALFTYSIRILELQASHRGTVWREYDERFRRI